MKLSLTWIFDHIDADWKSIPVEEIISKINSTTAEIEAFKKLNINLDQFEIAKVICVKDKITLNIINLNKEIILNNRLDAKENDIYLVKSFDSLHSLRMTGRSDEFTWASLHDLGSEKDGLLPDLLIHDTKNWKAQLENTDYILELDNKSITNRPDLWGHRGFAREIAAIFNLPLKPLTNFLETRDITEISSHKDNNISPFSIEIENENACKRFATYYIPKIEIKPSTLLIACRLAKIDARPINLVVDTTNYVMFDLSQPMHAFDANKLIRSTRPSDSLSMIGVFGPRFAKKGEKITLLDNETVELTVQDLVIADIEKPVALAGIMGGTNSEVDNNTTSLLIESANFDASTIRKTSAHVKKRTDASARFEKSLDPYQNIFAIERFIKLLSEHLNIENNKIISLGNKYEPKTIEIKHSFIEKRLGTKLEPDFVIKTLEKLEFLVEKNINKEITYTITVPTFRATKDITIPEDIVEEIGRFYGYGNIEFILPAKQIKPFDLKQTRRLRKIKQNLAFGAHMHEVQNYPFFDENFIKELSWQPENSTKVATPVSENWQRLVNSLIPHLLKNIQQNLLAPQKLRFFEINNIWQTDSTNKTIEEKSLAGIFFDKKNPVDFYECKAYLNNLFSALGFDIEWKKLEQNSHWYSQYQTAELFYENKRMGQAGMISKQVLAKITDGDAFIFEIDANFLLKEKTPALRFKTISKYPAVWLDVSLLVPLNITVNQVTHTIEHADPKIYKVELVDHFENPNWTDKKSLTMRYHLLDEHKTLSKEEIDTVTNNVIEQIKNIGAQVR